jgi:mRNA turnover protein 4
LIDSLTKTTRKTRADKERLMNTVKECADEYSTIFVFSVDNMRNQFMKEVRKELSDSRFMFGSNKVLIKALGQDPASEYKENLHLLTKYITGDVGLMFTNESVEDVKEFFENFRKPDYARAGNIANQTVVVPAGVLMRGDEPFPGNMDVQLRSLGMPLRRDGGKLIIDQDYTICKEGDVLSPNQSHLLVSRVWICYE